MSDMKYFDGTNWQTLKGEDGCDPVVTAMVNKTVTLPAGQNALAKVNVVGLQCEPEFRFEFSIPRGADGIGTDGEDGEDGKGWTGGGYNASTGIVTFTSDDGLGFSTGDLRGKDGVGTKGDKGDGWTGGSYNASDGIVTFTSSDGLGFTTGDLRGKDGIGTKGDKGDGWTGGSYNSSDGIVTFTSADGLGFSTDDLRGADGVGTKGDDGTSVDLTTVSVNTSDCSVTPDSSSGSFVPDVDGADGTKQYKLGLTLPRGTVVTESVSPPAGTNHCIGDLWIDSSTDVVEFEGSDLYFQEADGGLRSTIPYCMPKYGGARDGVFVVNGYIYSTDGKTWKECTSNGLGLNHNPWESGSYILKGIQSDGSPLYMDSNGREYSPDMLGWYGTYGNGAFPPAGAVANCFFWKGEYYVTAKIELFSAPTIYQHVFNTTINEWEGGTLGGGTTNGGNPIDPAKEILNGDTIWYGDSKPDGTAVLGCAKGAGDLGIPYDGEWNPVKLVDGGAGKDSFQPISALTPYAGQVRSIRYNENDDYWLAITKDKAFRSDVGSVDNWSEIVLPVSKPWTACEWDGSKWIAASMVTGDSLVLYSSDGTQWKTNNSIDPMWNIGEDNHRFLSVMSTNGVTIVGFSPGDCPYEYNITKK